MGTDPAWYYIAAYRSSGGNYGDMEALDTHDFYDWLYLSATDSVFSVSIAQHKTFKQAGTLSNSVEKDGTGRIITITHRDSNLGGIK